MRLLNRFKSLFVKEKEPEPEPILNDVEDLAFITVAIKKDMSLDMMCWWDDIDTDDELSIAFGTMLKFLTSGGYNFLIATSLKESDNDPEFVEKILDIWGANNLTSLADQLKKVPVINPLRTFGESNFGGE